MMIRSLRLCGPAALLWLAACQSLPNRNPAPPATDAPTSASTATPTLPRLLPEPETTAVTEPHLPRLDDYLPAQPAQPADPDPDPDPNPSANAREVLDRLRQRLIDPPCPDDPVVQHWIGVYGRSQTHFANQVSNMLPWIVMVLDASERYRLPGEFVLLPIVESSYRPQARGAGDHVGLWQLGRSTAAHLNLPVGPRYDGRMDGLASTEAAMRYLAEIQNRIGDWKLTALGYNVGPNRVRKLLQNLPDADFSAAAKRPVGLPDSSYLHVAKIQAWACLLAEPERHGLEMPGHEQIDPLVAVRLPPGQSSLPAIAKALNLDARLLTELNPGHRHGFVARESARELLLPASLASYLQTPFDLPAAAPPEALAAATAESLSDAGSKTVHIVRKGDTLSTIARQHGIQLRRLYRLNGLGARSVLRIGQRIRLVS